MKKFLASFAAACVALGAMAETFVDYEISYADQTKFPFYVMGYEPEIVGGVLKAENPGSWYQFFIADQIPTTAGKDYTATVRIKASEAGVLPLNMGWGWGEGEVLNSSINVSTEWQDVSATFQGVGGTNCNLVLQPGGHAGTIEIAWVTVSHSDEAIVIPTPEEGDVLASYFDGNGATFGGWGATAIDAAEEDGKPCLKIVNDEAKDNDWSSQIAINYDFVPGTTYYLNFDVKGTPFKGISSSFQSERDYKGCGNLNKFDITEEWKNVTIFGEAFDAGSAEDPNLPKRWVANFGKLAGTAYITNVRLYTAKTSGVKNVAVADDGRTVVYNLQGVKVLDTTDVSQIGKLSKGIYIINGKKVVVR